MCGNIDKPAPAISVSYAQAVNTDPNQALAVTAELIPAWRQNITILNVVVVSLVIAVALVVTWFRRRLWPVAAAAILAAGMYLTARIPVTWPGLEILMTWSVPTAVAAWCIWRALIRLRRKIPVAVPAGATLLLLIVMLSVSGGCTDAIRDTKAVADRPMIENIECSLSAGADSMELQYKLRISASEPSSFALLDESAVLVSPTKLGQNIAVKPEKAGTQ